jgi:hypothetical protein
MLMNMKCINRKNLEYNESSSNEGQENYRGAVSFGVV